MADGSGSGNSTVGSLLGDGFAEGVVHVITGPDHLSAIIVLTAGTTWRSWRLGAIWGFGHSLAMVVLSIPYVVSNEGFDIDTLGFYFDFIVGILMMLLGLWGLSHYIQVRDHARDKWITNEMAVGRGAFDPRGRDLQVAQESDTPAASSHNHAGHEQNVPELGGDDYYQRLSQQQRRPMNATDEMALAGSYSYCRACGGISTDITNSSTIQVMALAYGFVHGLAGTGGVIGELSHDVTHTAGKLAAYLGMISIGSIFIMSVVAAVYGELSGRFMVRSDANFYYGGVFSSMVSFCVGLLWIVLCDTQQLDNVFG